MTWTFAIAILVTLNVGVAAGQRSQSKARPDEEAIRTTLLERVESFNRHEAPRANTFTADADFVNVYGLWRKEAAEIEARQGERMQTALKDAKMKLIELRIRFIKPDVAIVHQRHEISGMRDAAGKTMPTVQELSIRVMVKEKRKWLTTAFHNTIVRSVEPPPAPTAQTALHFGANDLDGTITDGGELTHSYSVESNNEVKMTKQEIIQMIERAGFEAVERDTVYNRVAAV